MEREQKLALVIGFALILAVGVLVSDHLSKASVAEMAAAEPDDRTRLAINEVIDVLPGAPAAMPEGEPLPMQSQTQGQTQSQTRQASAMPQDAPVTPRGPVASNTPREPFVEINAGVHLPRSSKERVLAELTDDATDSLGGAIENATSRDGAGDADSGAFARAWQAVRNLGAEDLPAAAVLTPRDDEAAETRRRLAEQLEQIERETQAMPEQRLEQRVHFVKDGESLYKIAERYYSDGNKWRQIASANDGKIGSNGSVRVGVRLVIPGADAAVRTTKLQGTRTAAAPKPAPTPRVESYTVKRGDTLSEISQKLLGSARKAKLLIAANRDLIDDADDIQAGMVLTIPAG
ncbi:MAG: LysM peptidoglycan-binding domain-containing protein [Planctomycetota bacterium]